MWVKRFYIIALILLPGRFFAQEILQNVKGVVVDKQSQFPMMAIVSFVGDSSMQVATDFNGEFVLEKVPVGRHSFRISSLGYKTIVLNDLLITAGKELNLKIEMEEDLESLEEVVIVANDKRETINKMATVSARTFSVEEANRYSGSWADPSRMAQNYAGVVSARDDRNDIVIRGNSPTGLLWRMEGIDIPSPNHFATVGTTGSGISMLNINNLSNSDFMTSAWSADYGNALSGVFDLKLRNGNADKGEYLAQFGANGLEFGAEGPISKENNSSYLVNYRYSTTELLVAAGVDLGTSAAIPNYQDLTFKLNFPGKKKGTFTVWGLGGISSININTSGKDSTNLYSDFTEFPQENTFESQTGVVGASYLYFFNDKTSTKLNMAVSGTKVAASNVELVDTLAEPRVGWGYFYSQVKYSLHWNLNKKINSKNTISSGVIADVFDLVMADSNRFKQFGNQLLKTTDFSGKASLFQGYLQWQHKFNNKFKLNAGIHSQHFPLNNTHSLEPRVGLRYVHSPRSTFNIGVGMHSQTQPIVMYFRKDKFDIDSDVLPNKNLGFSRAIHYVVGHDFFISDNVRLKTEVYYQDLYNIPVDTNASSFSLLNSGMDFSLPDRTGIENGGRAYNYGLEFTLERFFNKGYYYLITVSLFESKYHGSDKIWRNTIYNGNYAGNLLLGKEIELNKNRLWKNILGFDTRLTRVGGQRYTPIDLATSQQYDTEILMDSLAYSRQLPDYFRWDFKVSYRWEGPRITHWLSLDIQNVTSNRNLFRRIYSPATDKIELIYQRGFFPLLQYKALF